MEAYNQMYGQMYAQYTGQYAGQFGTSGYGYDVSQPPPPQVKLKSYKRHEVIMVYSFFPIIFQIWFGAQGGKKGKYA